MDDGKAVNSREEEDEEGVPKSYISYGTAHHDGNAGVYFSNKILKLRRANAPANPSTKLFDGCFIMVNGLTDPPIEELKRLIYLNGGQFESYPVPAVTHVLTNIVTEAQLKRFSSVKRGLKYVNIQWLLSSISQNVLLSHHDYPPHGMASPRNKIQWPMTLRSLMQPNDGQSGLNMDPILDDTSCIVGENVSTENNPDFIHQYFSRSRLHFIGMWRTRLPKFAAKINQTQYLTHKAQHRQPQSVGGRPRVVVHVDMDCFFVSPSCNLVHSHNHQLTR